MLSGMSADTDPQTLATLEPVDAVHITTLIDNYSDSLMRDEGPARRVGATAGRRLPSIPAPTFEDGTTTASLIAEHGFSALVTVIKNGRSRSILFDTGVSPNGVVENMRRLELTPKDAEAIVLSHGHLDHTAGMAGIIGELGRANLPVIIHPEFWNRRRLNIPGVEPRPMPVTSRSALLGAGFEIIEEQRPSFLLDRSLLVTGEVDRTTEFETGFPVHEKLHEGAWVPDPLILDDQALIVHVRGKGLVVLTGCGHAGIVNILRYARKLTGVERIHATMGGFHLTGGFFEPVIPHVVRALAKIAPPVIVPAHCTGWRATHALAAALPGSFIQNSVGTRFELCADEGTTA
jgi:7,8-dihydropterin-6-yl-methyl-4-(beta-D-ribofuranosyl)aminobenzene 5'-phosphate synthase